jgi:hypothetical protein
VPRITIKIFKGPEHDSTGAGKARPKEIMENMRIVKWMNIMKDIKFLFFFILLCILPVSAFSGSLLEWQYDGTISCGNYKMKTELQNIYSGFPVSDGIYLAGFKIDENGINHPWIVFADRKLTNIKYWPQHSVVTQFFEHNQHVNFLNKTGEIYALDGIWHRSDFSLKPGSIIIFSNNYLIACNPAPLMKVSKKRGSCYSPQKKWDVDVSWRNITPSICNKVLTVVEDHAFEVTANQFDMQTGELLNRKKLRIAVKDACHAF